MLEEEQLYKLLRAFVEGNDHPVYLHPNKTSLLLESLRTGKMSSNASFYLGPLYWAYRKCFWPALALSSIYVACFVLCLCLLDQPLSSFLPMIAIVALNGFASLKFFNVYRTRAQRIISKALTNKPDMQTTMNTIRKKGGTSFLQGTLIVLYIASVTSALGLFLLAQM